MQLSPASETQIMPRLLRTPAGCSSTGRKGASRPQGSLDMGGHASLQRAGLAQRRRQRGRQLEALHRRGNHRDHPCSVATRSSGLTRRRRYAPFLLNAQRPPFITKGHPGQQRARQEAPFTSINVTTLSRTSWLRGQSAPAIVAQQPRTLSPLRSLRAQRTEALP